MKSKEELNKDIETILERATENFTMSIPADVIESNTEFEMHSGMRPRIIRSSDGNCCAWCSSLAGEYYADEAPDDIYRRHDNCNCTVTYESEKGYQDAHTKKWINQQEIDARRARIKENQEQIRKLLNNEAARKASRIIIDNENKAKRDILEAIRKPNAKVHFPAKKIDVEKYSFDGYHINSERRHNVTFQQASKFIQEADASVTVWNGRIERYYGKNGIAYVDTVNKKIITAFTKKEFYGDTVKVMEVIEKYGL